MAECGRTDAHPDRDEVAFALFLEESGQDEAWLRGIWNGHSDEHPVKRHYRRLADVALSKISGPPVGAQVADGQNPVVLTFDREELRMLALRIRREQLVPLLPDTRPLLALERATRRILVADGDDHAYQSAPELAHLRTYDACAADEPYELIRLEDAISNIDYPGSDAVEWTHKAKVAARNLMRAVGAAERAPFQKILATPAPGWFTFGTHVDQPGVELEFWGTETSLDGLPIWERPRATQDYPTAGPHAHTTGETP